MRVQLLANTLLVGLISSTVFAAAPWPRSDVAGLIVHAPKPEYPAAALQSGIRANGLFLIRVHIPTGRVTQVIVRVTTGNKLLDSAAVNALMTWSFKPGAVPYRKITTIPLTPPQRGDETLVTVPITFSP